MRASCEKSRKQTTTKGKFHMMSQSNSLPEDEFFASIDYRQKILELEFLNLSLQFKINCLENLLEFYKEIRK